MPPLLCLPPLLLDHSFPRDRDQLDIVLSALGEIEAYLQEEKCYLLNTDVFADFVESIDWSNPLSYPKIQIIYDFLARLYLQPSRNVLHFVFPNTEVTDPHPLPVKSGTSELSDLWSHEMAIILQFHDTVSNPFFVGIACPYAFDGQEIDTYPQTEQRKFPLVGQNDLQILEDAFDWIVPSEIFNQEVSFYLAKKNCFKLGAEEVEEPSGGSHYKVRFKGRRPWVLDPNNDPIPKAYLEELKTITGYSLGVIKMILIHGEIPKRRSKLYLYISSSETIK
ncbi:MAG: hypothetical protein IAE89_13720 [Anaerolineae bacterium]|nr:hypothetical protein [Anaerolineae bacterium]